MGDFFLDFRDARERSAAHELDRALRFYPDMRTTSHDGPGFRLTLTSCDREDLWAPYVSPSDGVLVAISGRLALETRQWDAAKRLPGPGGLACKAVYEAFRQEGPAFAKTLNGNFSVHIHDPASRMYHLATDPTGTSLAFGPVSGGTSPAAVCSHPDALARLLGGGDRRDDVSLAEFVMTGKVTPPHTYHADVRAWDHGCLSSFSLQEPARLVAREKFRELRLDLSQPLGESELADELAEAFRSATRRRTLPGLGRTLLALSGGLDSRMILCFADPGGDLTAFSCFDEENEEFRTARAIAREVGCELVPLRRPRDFYGDHAEQGVRISGGMGDIGSNHFIGFREELRGLGMNNLITGCYCDYLFKSLALDTTVHRVSRRESLGPFRMESYLPHFAFETPLAGRVAQRLDELFPAAMRSFAKDADRLEVAARRIFPLQYEGDNLERTTAHRVLGWSPPSIDNDVIDVFRRIPAGARLNKSLFARAVLAGCPAPVCRIPDANTTFRIGAPWPLAALGRYRIALRRSLERRRARIRSAESWPNWSHYLTHSERIAALWKDPRGGADDFFREVLAAAWRPRLEDYQLDYGRFRGTVLGMRLVTLKIWMRLAATA